MAGNKKRAAKKDPWTDEELLFGAKSKLLDVNLEVWSPRVNTVIISSTNTLSEVLC